MLDADHPRVVKNLACPYRLPHSVTFGVVAPLLTKILLGGGNSSDSPLYVSIELRLSLPITYGPLHSVVHPAQAVALLGPCHPRLYVRASKSIRRGFRRAGNYAARAYSCLPADPL